MPSALLIVDDERDSRVMQWVLQEAGIEVSVARGREETFSLVIDRTPDVIILNGGINREKRLTARLLRDFAPRSKIIALHPAAAGRRGAAIEADAHLYAPLHADDLIVTIESLV